MVGEAMVVVAMPALFSTEVSSFVVPSKNVMLPFGVPVGALAAAVIFKGEPYVAGSGAALRRIWVVKTWWCVVSRAAWYVLSPE